MRDAAAMASLHAASFHRGWSDGEFESLLSERNVIADRAAGAGVIWWASSCPDMAADEAEILSIAVAAARAAAASRATCWRCICGRFAGAACRTMFLEVDETNQPARRLYKSRRISRSWPPRQLL